MDWVCLDLLLLSALTYGLQFVKGYYLLDVNVHTQFNVFFFFTVSLHALFAAELMVCYIFEVCFLL